MQFTEREIATVNAALAAWEHRLADGERWIRSVYDFGGHAPLTKHEVRALQTRLAAIEPTPCADGEPAMWKVSVPTYVGAQPHEDR